MDSASCKTKSEQEQRNKSSIAGYGTIEIPELEALLDGAIPWDDIDPIIATYYPKFAANRQVAKLIEFIEEKFGSRITKSCIGKRYERLKESGGTND